MATKRVVGRRARRRQNSNLVLVIGGIIIVAVLAVVLVVQNSNASVVATQLATPVPAAPLDSCGSATCGQANAPVTLDLYADFQCPYCGQFEPELQQIKANYIDTGKVKLVYHNFPFIGQESVAAGQAALCAGDQNQFWRFANNLFRHQGQENSGTFSSANLKAMAAGLGLNTSSFNSCLDSGKYSSAVNADYSQGQAKGVQSTPTFFINGQKNEGGVALSQLTTLLDAAVAKK